jgi:hypothetical protein
VDTTIRNLDEQAYKALRVRAIIQGRTVGDLISDAIRGYLLRVGTDQKRGSLRALKPEPFPEGNEHLSLEIDSIVYGQR